MRAVVFHAIGVIRLGHDREPELREPTDAIVQITSPAFPGLKVSRGPAT